MGWKRHETLDDTLAFIERGDAQWQNEGVGPFVIELRDQHDAAASKHAASPVMTRPVLVGATGFKLTKAVAADEVELGYIFAKPFWGQGFASETLLAMIAYAKERGFRRLVARVHEDNTASDYILLKHGLQRPAEPLPRGSCPNLDSQDYLQLDYELMLNEC